MSESSGVLVIGETSEGKLASITAELLGSARALAGKLNEKVSVLVMGSGIAGAAGEAGQLGADKVLVADDAILKDYQTDVYTAVAASAAKEANPRYILIGQTSIGRDLAPRLAFRLGTVATTDCISLDVDAATKGMLQTKPVYGGNARAIFTSASFPQVATVRQKAMSPAEPDASRKAELVNIAVHVDASAVRYKVIERVKEKAEGVKLEDAKVVVCGGRGIGGPEGFKQLEELARLLKGAVGASRPACDSGWIPSQVQIGLTGKIVTPDVYIAIGISGASQHLAGCSGAKNIIAVNKDAEANIFKEARFGVVGDWNQVLPAFVAKAKELRASSRAI
ncbi:MAG: electron transfer flavoprotein subunit alpha/FixB family protein [Dehalococcoidia bacterium]|nr:electron transfer flavoprotein subunit alpha/FixB family protein [Dehalococcoidia bacterium]